MGSRTSRGGKKSGATTSAGKKMGSPAEDLIRDVSSKIAVKKATLETDVVGASLTRARKAQGLKVDEAWNRLQAVKARNAEERKARG